MSYQLLQMGNEVKNNNVECQQVLTSFDHVTQASVYAYLKNKYGGKITNRFDDYHISKETIDVRIDGEHLDIEIIHVVLSDLHYLEIQTDVDRFEDSDKYYYEHNHTAYLVTDISDLTEIDQQYIQDEIEIFMEEWEQTYVQESSLYLKDEDSNYYTIITQPKF